MTASIAWYCFMMTMPKGNGILSSSLTVGAIFAGFLATCKAILMSSGLHVMKRLRDTGYIIELVRYLAEALWFSFALCEIALLGFFVDTKSSLFGVFWIFILVGTAACFIRFARIMLLIIRYNP